MCTGFISWLETIGEKTTVGRVMGRYHSKPLIKQYLRMIEEKRTTSRTQSEIYRCRVWRVARKEKSNEHSCRAKSTLSNARSRDGSVTLENRTYARLGLLLEQCESFSSTETYDTSRGATMQTCQQ